MVIELNRNGTAPPINMPMNSVGLEMVSIEATSVIDRLGNLLVLAAAARADRDNIAVEQRDGGDHGRADGDALGNGLGRVAHRVEVGQDLPGPLVILRRHVVGPP